MLIVPVNRWRHTANGRLTKMERAWRIEPAPWDDDRIRMSWRPKIASVIRSSVPVPSCHLPLRIELYEDINLLPDFGCGPMSEDRLVSQAFRELAEELDPGAGDFASVELANEGQENVVGKFWHFRVAKPVDALIPEMSPVSEVRNTVTGELKGFAWKSYSELTLNRERLEDRHLWTLPNLRNAGVFVSDRMLEEMTRRGMEPFRRRQLNLV